LTTTVNVVRRFKFSNTILYVIDHDRLRLESFGARPVAAAAVRLAFAFFRPFDDAPAAIDPMSEAEARPIAATSVGSARGRGEGRLASKPAPTALSAPGLRPAPSNQASAAPLRTGGSIDPRS
jgi:hypothetical protein